MLYKKKIYTFTVLSRGNVEKIVLAVTVGGHGLLNEDMQSQLK